MPSCRLVVVSAILITAVACGGGGSSSPTSPLPSPAPTSSGAPATVVIAVGAQSLGSRAYTPPELNVAVGTTVTWMNADRESHTSTSDAPGWNSGALAAGRQFSVAFPTAGRFAYHCTIHPGMVGSVVVR